MQQAQRSYREVTLYAALVLVAGCAVLRAPLSVEPPSSAASGAGANQASRDQAATEDTILEVVEGRPNGVLLRLKVAGAQEGDALELLRRDASGWSLYQRFEVEPRLVEALARGVDFVDRRLERAGDYGYALQLMRGEPKAQVARSSVIELRWETPARRPEAVTVEAIDERSVVVRWRASAGLGAVILRRDLLVARQGYQRVALVKSEDAGLFVDTGVEATGVYAYRVAHARSVEERPFFGQLSEEFFVTVPPAAQQGGEATSE